MDQKECEEATEIASDFNEKILSAVDKPIVCPTPDKSTEPLPIKSKEGQTLLPQKYRVIADLFNHMSCSLRLLHLRKKAPIFQNICKQVEVLAKREFSYAHLAQMKYILPEGVHIDKVLVHDKKTLCMKPDMKITLIFEVVKEKSNESADLALRRYFSSRLIDFFKTHPEVTDIPEAILPEPFSQTTCSLISEDLLVNSSTALFSTSNQIELLPEKFHLYPSFRRHFSKNVADQSEMVQLCSSAKTSLSSHASDCLDNQESENIWQKGYTPVSDSLTNLHAERGLQKESFSMTVQPSVINTPVHMICPPHTVTCSSSKSTNMKNPSFAVDSLMTQTPAQSAPERLLPISDEKLRNMTTQKSASFYKPAKRVLDFSLVEGHDDLDLGIRVDKLETSRAPYELDSIPESRKGCSEDFVSFGSVTLPQEEESCGYSYEDTTQNEKKSLLDLVDVIQSIFHSVRTLITKEELLQKIIMNSLDLVEIKEVEEQIDSLEKLVPGWICKKLVPSGDIMYCIKKGEDMESVRSRLFGSAAVGVE